jgi:hypothetical protein
MELPDPAVMLEQEFRGNKSAMAKAMMVSRPTIYAWLKRGRISDIQRIKMVARTVDRPPPVAAK